MIPKGHLSITVASQRQCRWTPSARGHPARPRRKPRSRRYRAGTPRCGIGISRRRDRQSGAGTAASTLEGCRRMRWSHRPATRGERPPLSPPTVGDGQPTGHARCGARRRSARHGPLRHRRGGPSAAPGGTTRRAAWSRHVPRTRSGRDPARAENRCSPTGVSRGGREPAGRGRPVRQRTSRSPERAARWRYRVRYPPGSPGCRRAVRYRGSTAPPHTPPRRGPGPYCASRGRPLR